MRELKWKRSNARPQLYVAQGPGVKYDIWAEIGMNKRGTLWRAYPSIRPEEPGWNYIDRGLVQRRFRRLADAKRACLDHAFFDEQK